MPDGITITPEAPKVKAADVIASADHKVEATGGISTATESGRNLLASIDTKDKINELKAEKDGSLKDQVAKRKEVPDYTQEDFKKTSEALGVDTVLKADYEALAKYLEAIKKSSREGTPLTLPNGARENIGRILYMRGGVSDKLSDFEDAFQGNKVAMYRFIEDSFGRDTGFQREIVRVLQRIKTESRGIESTQESDEVKKLKENRSTIDARAQARFDSIKRSLASLDTPTIESIKKGLDAGLPTKSSLLEIEDGLVKSNGLEDKYFSLKDYSLQLQQADIIKSTLKQKRADKANLESVPPKNRNNAKINALTQEIARLEVDEPSARNQAKIMKEQMLTADYTEDSFNQDLGKYRKIQGTIGEGSAITTYLEEYKELKTTIDNLDAQIKSLEALTTPEKAAEQEELKKKLQGELEGAIDEAMAEFLSRRYEDAATDRDIELDEAKKKAEKDGKTWKAGALGEIKKLFSDIRKYDKKERKFVYNKDRMAGTLRRLSEYSADGKDGSRQLFAETVGFKIDPDELKEQIAQQVGRSPDATYEGLTEQQKLDADSLIAQRTADFESLYAEHGESFKKTLFESYFANKGFMDKIGHGKLSLTDDEVAILNKQFGSLMESELEKSGLMKTLKEKGIVPDSKLKILLALLAILGIGAVAAVGIAPAAIATAGAAKGIGSAAWSEGIV